MNKRYAKMYVTEIREEDRVTRLWSPTRKFGRVFRVRNMGSGRIEIRVQFGGDEETWTLNDNSMIWIEVP